jgi:hypothetical protein
LPRHLSFNTFTPIFYLLQVLNLSSAQRFRPKHQTETTNENAEQLLATDILVLAPMKNAGNCDT